MSLNDERTVNYSIHCNFYRASVSGQKAKLQNAFRKPYSMNIPFNLQEFSSRSYPLMRIHIIGQSCNNQLRSNQCKVVLDGFFLFGNYWISISLTHDAMFKSLIPFALILIPLFLSVFFGLSIFIVGNFDEKKR